VAEHCGVPIPPNYPAMGADAFRTGTGVHAAAVIKALRKKDRALADRVYSAVPASVLGRAQRIEVGPMSGESNVVYWLDSHGVVLVDTGIGEGNAWIDEHYRPRRRDVREALRASGLAPESVATIVNTHLHFDHCGQNRAFAGVPIVVQRAERELARREGQPFVEWLEFPGARYELVEGDREVAPGVSVLATPGHTAGHQSVVVRTDDGLMLIVG